jgi:hypothetical protein
MLFLDEDQVGSADVNKDVMSEEMKKEQDKIVNEIE